MSRRQRPAARGNVLANTITSMGQGVPGVDTVTNAIAFTNGVDAESDAAYKARFVLYHRRALEGDESCGSIGNRQCAARACRITVTENFDYNGDL